MIESAATAVTVPWTETPPAPRRSRRVGPRCAVGGAGRAARVGAAAESVRAAAIARGSADPPGREGDAADRHDEGEAEQGVESMPLPPAGGLRTTGGSTGASGGTEAIAGDGAEAGWNGTRGIGVERIAGWMVGHRRVSLFVAKGGDRVEPGGLARRPDAEHDADGEAEQDGRGDGRRVELEAPAGELADQGRDGEAERRSR